jgi:eukaryotic-like serine/threonine-protein kinase
VIGYQQLTKLGSGGMATVYLARKIGAAGFERLVVLKRIHPHLVEEKSGLVPMLRDEARLAALVRHPNVVSVIDVVEDEGQLVLVLEYVEGVSLAVLINRAHEAGVLLPPAVVSRIMVDALRGLHAAHEARDPDGNHLQIVHRDVSPQNIVVGADGITRIIDFGVAKGEGRSVMTSSGMMKGKLMYLSPEQIKLAPLDRRADVFAAGVVLHEALVGRRLFRGSDEGDVLLGILVREIEDPSSLVPGLPPALDAVIQRALARDREERFQTAAELADALEEVVGCALPREVAAAVRALAGAELAATAEAMREARSASATLTPVVASGQTPSVPRQLPAPLLAGAVALAAAIGLVLGRAGPGAASVQDASPERPSRVDIAATGVGGGLSSAGRRAVAAAARAAAEASGASDAPGAAPQPRSAGSAEGATRPRAPASSAARRAELRKNPYGVP